MSKKSWAPVLRRFSAPFRNSSLLHKHHFIPEKMYTALSAEKREIRLLRILPAQDESSQVACECSSISLLDNPVYDALSYVWGDPTVTTPILVNGEVFNATTNLAAALRVFRAKGMEDLLWIDAICIDQGSVEEKNQQLPLMRDIYVKARKTLVWFGDGGEAGKGEALAFKLIRRWVAALNEARNLVRQDELDIIKRRGIRIEIVSDLTPDAVAEIYKIYSEKMGDCLGHKLGDEFDMSEYTALMKLRMNPYWDRVWVMQEFVLAQDLVFLLGHDAIDYNLLEAGLRVLKDHRRYGLSKSLQKAQLRAIAACSCQGWHRLIDIRFRWLKREPGTACSLWELINMNVDRKSSNPLDAVYGLLSLVSSPEVPITIDYSMSPVKLFTDLTLNFIVHPSVGLNILSLVGTPFRPQSSDRLSLPSWIPQFGRLAGIPDYPLPPFHYYNTTEWFHRTAEWDISADAQATATKLGVNGVICGTVQDIRGWSDSLSGNIAEWLDLLLSNPTPYPCGIPKIQGFFRTIKGDHSGFGIRKPGFKNKLAEAEFFQFAGGFIELFPQLIHHESNITESTWR